MDGGKIAAIIAIIVALVLTYPVYSMVDSIVSDIAEDTSDSNYSNDSGVILLVFSFLASLFIGSFIGIIVESGINIFN